MNLVRHYFAALACLILCGATSAPASPLHCYGFIVEADCAPWTVGGDVSCSIVPGSSAFNLRIGIQLDAPPESGLALGAGGAARTFPELDPDGYYVAYVTVYNDSTASGARAWVHGMFSGTDCSVPTSWDGTTGGEVGPGYTELPIYGRGDCLRLYLRADAFHGPDGPGRADFAVRHIRIREVAVPTCVPTPSPTPYPERAITVDLAPGADPCAPGEFDVDFKLEDSPEWYVASYRYFVTWDPDFTFVSAAHVDGGANSMLYVSPPQEDGNTRMIMGWVGNRPFMNGTLFRVRLSSPGFHAIDKNVIAEVDDRGQGIHLNPDLDARYPIKVPAGIRNESRFYCLATNTPTNTLTPTPTFTITPSPTVSPTLTYPDVCAATPLPGDFDGDGIPDSIEFEAWPADTGTNMYLWDSDRDGLSDGFEDANANGVWDPGELNPRSRDTDGDGLWDGMEIRLGYDPLNPFSPSRYTDEDGDGLPASVDPNDHNPDTDGDLYADGYEFIMLGAEAVEDARLRPQLGDLNCDGVAGALDLLLLWQLVGNAVAPADLPGIGNADINGDGYIGILDYATLQRLELLMIDYLPAN